MIASNGFATIGDGLALDFQFPADPVVTDNFMGVYLNATLFNSTAGYSVPDTQLSNIALNLTGNNSIAVDVTSYTADSLLKVLHEAGFFKGSISQADISAKYSSFLSTTYLDGFLPGLVNTYGKDQPVTILFSSSAAPHTFFNPDEMGASLSVILEFQVNDQSAITLEIHEADAFVQTSLEDFTLHIKIESLAVKSIQQIQSNIGDISPLELKTFFNVLFKIAIPIINELLANGFAVPTEFMDMVKIESA